MVRQHDRSSHRCSVRSASEHKPVNTDAVGTVSLHSRVCHRRRSSGMLPCNLPVVRRAGLPVEEVIPAALTALALCATHAKNLSPPQMQRLGGSSSFASPESLPSMSQRLLSFPDMRLLIEHLHVRESSC